MTIFLNLILTIYFIYSIMVSGSITAYPMLFISILNFYFIYSLLSSNKNLKDKINNTYLESAVISKDNFHDALTGIYNRRYFDVTFSKFIKKAEEYNITFSILMIDIDHFKKFNDTYGHKVGDDVLKVVSSTIKKNIRNNQDMFFRYGGEEFIIITTDSLDGAITLAKKINSLEFIPAPEKITVSIGISTRAESKHYEELVKLADDNLYKAKEAGRNCFKY